MGVSRLGYAGKILRVDLTRSVISTQSTYDYVSRFLGGRGINQWILLREQRSQTTPFEPASIICFGAGALVGTLVPGAARLNIDSMNTFTAGIGSGSAGGWFAAELKFAGYDHIVVQGKARKPVYLSIEDEKVCLRPAAELWGKTTGDTEILIKDDIGREDIQVLSIGPAGENLARQACVIVSGMRAVGRCGLGAIMGSKNLKAIAVKGTGSIEISSPNEFMTLVEQVSERLIRLNGAKARKEFGTFRVSELYNDLSALAYKNYLDDFIPKEHFAQISPEVFRNKYDVGGYACSACPTPCGHVYFVDSGPFSGKACMKAESNSLWDFGGRLAITDPAAILRAQEECCQLGLDIDNSAGVIAWAIDCFQNGIISEKVTDGIELSWGNPDMVLSLLKKIAYREGFGDLLAEGSFRASHKVGGASSKYAFHVKGQDLIEAIRSMKGWALGVVVSARGGAHTRGALATEVMRYSPEDSQRIFGVNTAGDARSYKGKPKIVSYFEYVISVLDSLGICFFTGNWGSPEGISPVELARFYSLATGIPTSEAELLKIGERIHNVEKMFNVLQASFARKDDYPPERFMQEPVQSGPLKGELLQQSDWDKMLDEYYYIHGWDKETSWPTKEKLRELDLDEAIAILEEKYIHDE